MEGQENLTNKSIYSLVVVESHMVDGEPENVTNESLGLIGGGGGVGLCGVGEPEKATNKSLGLVGGGVGLCGGGGEPEKTTNKSLGLVGGGGGLCGSNCRVYCKTLVSIFF